MHARVASFEGGDGDRLQQLTQERMESGQMETPAGMKKVLLLNDRDSNRRLFIAFFESREQLDAAEEGFNSMGDTIPEDIRGRRTSVDVYEVVSDQEV